MLSARRMAEEAIQGARELLSQPPALIERAEGLGLDTSEVQDAYRGWLSGTALDGLVALAEHLESSIEPLQQAIGRIREQARLGLERRESLWRPIAASLAGWLERARPAQRGEEKLSSLKSAESWLKSASADIRNERFRPIATEAISIWQILRQQSNVDLGSIELEGTSTRRRVTLDVTVDGVAGAALGVMSQGELNSLALSLFLPRATLPESPFRFVVIDDPVQSMDPARVDGLARVLERCAKNRQVLVFTHDARLAEAVRRLQIRATVIEVTRQEGVSHWTSSSPGPGAPLPGRCERTRPHG